MIYEIKQEEGIEQKPEGEAAKPAPAPNQGPSAEELQKKIQELEATQKEKDAKIADLETTRATIEARKRQVETETNQLTDAELEKRLAQVEEKRAYDPQGAIREQAALFKENKSQAIREVQENMSRQAYIDKLRSGVQSSRPYLTQEAVDMIMDRANSIAAALTASGQRKSPEAVVEEAANFIEAQVEIISKKKHSVPPLPPGASAEGGGANQPPKVQEPPKLKTALEELEEHNEARYKKVM